MVFRDPDKNLGVSGARTPGFQHPWLCTKSQSNAALTSARIYLHLARIGCMHCYICRHLFIALIKYHDPLESMMNLDNFQVFQKDNRLTLKAIHCLHVQYMYLLEKNK